MCELFIANERIGYLAPETVESVFDEWYAKGKNCFHVHRTPDEYLTVVLSDRFAIIVYTKDDAREYLALDASTSPEVSSERISMMVGNEATPFSKNMRLSRSQGIEVVSAFCRTGVLLPDVYWIPERAA